MKPNKRLLFINIAIPLITGGVATLLTKEGMEVFEKPPFSPAGWVFPIVWTILYILMGISFYLVQTSGADAEEITKAGNLYGYQLAVNFLWPTFFFQFEWYFFSLIWLVLLWILVLLMIRAFFKISKLAAYLNIPYLLWLTFAAYLNFEVWLLNK